MSQPAATIYRWPPATKITVCQKPSYPRPEAHPITRDPAALEKALAAIVTSAKQHAARVGTLPEDDYRNETFRKEHGRLAAMLNNTVEEAHVEAMNMLCAHALMLLPPEPFNEMLERIGVETARLNRYVADTRPRH